MTGYVLNPTHGTASRWVRRRYDDPKYATTDWHRIVSTSDDYVTTLCGRKLARHTAAKSYNRLEYESGTTGGTGNVCLHCSGQGGRRYR